MHTLKLVNVAGPNVLLSATSGIAAPRDQHPADARRVVTRVEGMPLPAEKHLEPGSEIHRIVHRRHTDVAEVPGAVARGDVHAATEGNGKMREITADAMKVSIVVRHVTTAALANGETPAAHLRPIRG